jgi:hypothetical protein
VSDWWEDAPLVAGGTPDEWWKAAPEVEQSSIEADVARQGAQGISRGLNAMYYLPSNIINRGAQLFGYEPPLATPGLETLPSRAVNAIAGRPVLNAPQYVPPSTTAGRYASSIGEMIGGAVIPEAGLMSAGTRAAPPATQAIQALIGAGGAGITSEYAKEQGWGPAGQFIAGLAGGFGAPLAANAAVRARQGLAAAGRYAGGQYQAAMGEMTSEDLARQGAIERIVDRLPPGVSVQQLRDNTVPQLSGALQKRGLTAEDSADFISRGLDGESPAMIGRDYGMSPATVSRYVNLYRRQNPTPTNILDDVTELAGEGAAQPLSRLGRAAGGVAEAPEAMQRLYERQLEQPGRAASIVQRIAPGQDYEIRLDQLQQQARQEAAANYTALHNQPDVIVTRELGELLAQPLARTQWERGRMLAEAEGQEIPSYDELSRTFGLRPRGGLGLNRETGLPEPPEQYPPSPIGFVPPKQGMPPPAPPQPASVVPVRALDYFQRALRLDAEKGGTEGHALNALRQRFLNTVDPGVAGQPTLVPNFRSTLSSYRTSMAGQEALEAGANMTTKLGAPVREALSEFDSMAPAQQELFRMGFARKLMDQIGNKVQGAGVASQFSSRGTQDMIRRIFAPADASELIRNLNRESITTRTFQGIAAGSRTAPMSADMANLLATGRAAADVATGRWGRVLENASNRLTNMIGQTRGEAILNALTETRPSDKLRMLNDMARISTRRQAERQLVETLRPYTAPGLSAGVAAGAAGSALASRPKSVRQWRAQAGQ